MITDTSRPRIGFMFDRDRRPEELAGFAATVEELGAGDLWVVEDLGWTGAISAATVALAATRTLRVGIGIAPVALRNPALLAMELATVARIYPERLVAGLGHGVTDWMRQVGAAPKSPLSRLEESIVVTRGLLAGETVTMHGREVTVDGVTLVHPPAVVPPIVTGVVRPKSLELSGRVADGTIVAEGNGPAELTDALGHIARGRAAGTRPAHELIAFAYLHVGDDPARAAAETGEMVAGQAAWLGKPAEELFTLIGSADSVPAKVAALHTAGATTVVLRPLGSDPDAQARAALEALRTA
ncbi:MULTISPECIES: LLM class flavin-dependent oxidoreductase [Catenuloplanes]|uniref:Alkanesulfonate monooxygenase SsuD/methylene tetrahydromethanopterin reductase-like flavin-dependent oxidoreductase (Luciferase family) n=1 Tax=Catenuloplanes niger TaxID=587534 RepID=A0AAE4A0C0_9ACTN|nr:LLM class flavin-dependent oxidoreductase [Catenuloplanes niger]MDR7327263.1 alkanesulfonate monooxygenase SsuD/methylene tetrahydromethanopterin reductase-like flavin-dependent oxidoreductase (luciferase family) [Catenuloplanes niger]